MQVHGLFVPATEGEGTPGEVNGTAGYKAVLPVANGILLPVTDAEAAQDFAALGETLENGAGEPALAVGLERGRRAVLANHGPRGTGSCAVGGARPHGGAAPFSARPPAAYPS